MWKCDSNRTFPLEELCDEYLCQDKTDKSFCECGKGLWKCPKGQKCIDVTTVCDRASNNQCNCPNCAEEDEYFCLELWRCPKGSIKISGKDMVQSKQHLPKIV